jgi:uncharacterized membrane protein
MIAFAVAWLGLGAAGLYTGVVPPVWGPIPPELSLGAASLYLCSGFSLLVGAGLLAPRTRAHASRALVLVLAAWSLAFHGAAVVRSPASFEAWYGLAENAAVVAAAWCVLVRLAGQRGVDLARRLYGVALLGFGAGHLVWLANTAALVPSWLPAHEAWAYATAVTFLAAAAGVLSGVMAMRAATLSAVQIAGFTLLVWVPALARGGASAAAWSECGLSAVLAVAGAVVADSYRG